MTATDLAIAFILNTLARIASGTTFHALIDQFTPCVKESFEE